jgi:protein SCO1
MKTTALIFLLAAAALQAAPGKPCCQPEAKKTAPHASHVPEELPAAAPTDGSLYHIETKYLTDAGRPFALAELRGRPVIMSMFFSSCSYACPMLVADMTKIYASLSPDIRARVALVLVTFDSVRDTPAVLNKFRESRQLGPEWTLLHGNKDAVSELAALLGVKYKQEADGQFAHSNIITFLNEEGEIVHQRLGLKSDVSLINVFR